MTNHTILAQVIEFLQTGKNKYDVDQLVLCTLVTTANDIQVKEEQIDRKEKSPNRRTDDLSYFIQVPRMELKQSI